MAQYDLLLTQNVHATLVEFSEQFVNISKAGLLSANAAQDPVVLAGGTDGYILSRDDAETSGLIWIDPTSLGVSVANQGDDRVITATASADALNAEANLTYNTTQGLLIGAGNGIVFTAAATTYQIYTPASALKASISIVTGTNSAAGAGDISLIAGAGVSAGGNVYFQRDTTYGNFYFGTGTVGHLPAQSTETSIVYYESTTGKLSYGSGNLTGQVTSSAFVTTLDVTAITDQTEIVNFGLQGTDEILVYDDSGTSLGRADLSVLLTYIEYATTALATVYSTAGSTRVAVWRTGDTLEGDDDFKWLGSALNITGSLSVSMGITAATFGGVAMATNNVGSLSAFCTTVWTDYLAVGTASALISFDVSNNMTFKDAIVTTAVTLSDLLESGTTIGFGLDNEIPYTKSTVDGYDYNSLFAFTGNQFFVGAEIVLTDSGGGHTWTLANASGEISAVHSTNTTGTGYGFTLTAGASSSVTPTHHGAALILTGGGQTGVGGGDGGNVEIFGGASVGGSGGDLKLGPGTGTGSGSLYITNIGSDDAEDHVLAIDDSTGLVTKRSVASITGGGTGNVTIGDGTDQDMYVHFDGLSANANYVMGWDESESYFRLYNADAFGLLYPETVFAWNPSTHSFILGISAYTRDAKLNVYENGAENCYMRNVSSAGSVLTLSGTASVSTEYTLLCSSNSVDTFEVRGDGSILAPALASDDAEDHVVAIDDSTGLLTKRSVASLVRSSGKNYQTFTTSTSGETLILSDTRITNAVYTSSNNNYLFKIEIWGYFTASGGSPPTIALRVKLGTTTLFTTGALTDASGDSGVYWKITATVGNYDDTTSYFTYITEDVSPAGQNPAGGSVSHSTGDTLYVYAYTTGDINAKIYNAIITPIGV